MSTVRPASAYLAVLLGSFVSGLVTVTRLTGTSSVLDESAPSWHNLYESANALAALAAIVGVVVAVVVRRTVVAGSLAVVGLLLLSICAAAGFGDGWGMYAASVASGAVIGALCALSTQREDAQWCQTWLVTGLLAGFVLAIPLDQTITGQSLFDRNPADAPVDWTVLFLAVAAVALLMIALVGMPTNDSNEQPHQRRAVVVGIGLPVCSLLLYWWWVADRVRNVDEGGTWLVGYALVPLAVAGALWLPGRSGLVLLALIAFLSSNANDKLWNSGWSVIVTVAFLVAIAAVIGRMWRRPLIGIAVLAVCAATGFLDQSASNNVSVTLTLVAASATAYAMAASVPSTSPAVALSMATPGYSVIGIGMVYVTFGYAGDDTSFAGVSRFPASTTESILALGSVIACGLAIAYLGRRDETSTVTSP